MAGEEGEPCGCKSAMDGSSKEQQDKMPACGEVLYYSGSTFGFAMEHFISLSLSLPLSLSLVYAASVLQQKAAGRKSMLL